MKKYLIPILGILSVTAIIVFWTYEKRGEEAMPAVSEERRAECEAFLTVALFPDDGSADRFMDDCLAGKPVLPEESTPPTDASASPTVEDTAPVASGGCVVGGCSAQLCGEASDMEGMVTTCEYRDEYACYQTARCERQASGQCGWTETSELNQCLANAR